MTQKEGISVKFSEGLGFLMIITGITCNFSQGG